MVETERNSIIDNNITYLNNETTADITCNNADNTVYAIESVDESLFINKNETNNNN
jgi:hypothetical protein